MLKRERGTFILFIPKSRIAPFIQFTLKDPFYVPHCEHKDRWTICGWLFFYFGIIYMN